MKPQSLVTLGLLLPLLPVACDRPATVVTSAPPPQFDFTNGPSDLPNVFRGDSILLFVWPDYTTNLVIAVNAPDGGVSSLRRCGSSLRPEPQPVQTVGEMQDVMRQLRLLRDVNIHVYSPVPAGFSGFMSLCGATPIAQGTGNLISTDNDRLVTGNGANAFGFRAEGTVDLVAGGSARVLAEEQMLILPDGTCCLLRARHVMLLAH
ncbi:MAG: hypothetical protein DMD29_14090 [Gemmatimonadetes bacterium]|nr:MAG: hypothetical protein DMD29_14090 [Gemmatimonadota bacterium]